MREIKGFQGEDRVYSNFFPCTVTFGDLTYKSSEAAYQAQKFDLVRGLIPVPQANKSLPIWLYFTNVDARIAARTGKEIEITTPNWDKERLNVMYRVVRAKFTQNRELKEQLLSTGDAYMEETNYWKDTFWGVYNGVGLNHLGKILMLVRDELREGII